MVLVNFLKILEKHNLAVLAHFDKKNMNILIQDYVAEDLHPGLCG